MRFIEVYVKNIGGKRREKYSMKIRPAQALSGEIKVPGDKSISHRAAIFAAMAKGVTRIENYSASLDCNSTLNCLRGLGVKVSRSDLTVTITGVGKDGFHKPENALDCGNSGTTMRLLAGLLAGQNFDSILTGDESLKKRPMKRVIEPLNLMGTRIESQNGHAPLKVFGKGPFRGVKYKLPIASAQLKGAIMLAGLNADGETVIESPPSRMDESASRNHTELMLKYFGAKISEEFVQRGNEFRHKIRVSGESILTARDIQVPGDISSFSFFLVAACCLDSSAITILDVGLNPTRAAVIYILEKLGAKIEVSNRRVRGNEPVGDVRVTGNRTAFRNRSVTKIGGDVVANIIDEIPLLAVLGTQLEGGLEIRDAGELRVKESDRIHAVVTNLKRMNAKIEEYADGFLVKRSNLLGAKIDSFGDHRIAMAFSIAGLLADGETEIRDADCVKVSFPNFFEELLGASV